MPGRAWRGRAVLCVAVAATAALALTLLRSVPDTPPHWSPGHASPPSRAAARPAGADAALALAGNRGQDDVAEGLLRPAAPPQSPPAHAGGTKAGTVKEANLPPLRAHPHGEGRSPWNTNASTVPEALLRAVRPRAVARLLRWAGYTGLQADASADGDDEAGDDEAGVGGAADGRALALLRQALRGGGDARRALCHPRGATSDAFEVDPQALARRRVALLAVTTGGTPRSFAAAARSWNRSGLLRWFDEKLLWVNGQRPHDPSVALARELGFTVVSPATFQPLAEYQWATRFPEAARLRAAPRPSLAHVGGTATDSWGIGPSLAVALDVLQSESVLLLEKDFAVEAAERSAEDVAVQLLNALLFAQRGARVVRLRAIEDHGGEGWQKCCPACWSRSSSYWNRQGNWFSFYCPPPVDNGDAARQVSRCYDDGDAHSTDVASRARAEADTACFTSADSNWSNNPALISREWAFSGVERDNLALVALSELFEEEARPSAMFEVYMLNREWGRWRTPVCIARRGIFRHREIDG